MSVRCPYCHDAPPADAPGCRSCGAPAHADCALELGRCAACGDSRFDGLPARPLADWGFLAGPDGGTFQRAALTPLDETPPPRVRLDLQRRADPPGGLVAGTLWVDVPRGATRPGVELVWLDAGAPRRVTLLVPRPAGAAAPGWRHRVDFRTPAPTALGARLALDLDGRLRVWPGWHGVEAGRGWPSLVRGGRMALREGLLQETHRRLG